MNIASNIWPGIMSGPVHAAGDGALGGAVLGLGLILG